jgi:hypothetical protein
MGGVPIGRRRLVEEEASAAFGLGVFVFLPFGVIV